MRKAKGVVYLTDGFERLDLLGRESDFTLGEDWVIYGTPCTWEWPHEEKALLAGGEIVISSGEVFVVDVGAIDVPPKVVSYGERIVITPRISVLSAQMT